jgi:predicted RNase H-like nuclease (RuvC/YqgF family)
MTTETQEIRNAAARVEQDTNGRYISVIIYDKDSDGNPTGGGTEYSLTATTQTDDAAYNDAMNQYNYEKAVYNQELNNVNSKIEIIQSQDKDLELRLKQLDTEQNAINTEMESVKKVISKNVENTFKTFQA